MKSTAKVQVNAEHSMLIADLNKQGLRDACKHNGIKYGSMNNDGMRAALLAHVLAKQADQGIGPVASDGRPKPVDAPKPATVMNVLGISEKTQAAIKQAAPVVEIPVVDAGPRETVTGTVVKPKSLKIEKGREKQYGVSRPSAGSICRAIWDQLDAKRAASKAVPSFADLRDLMKNYSWSKNTAMTQFQRWKQFNGVMPRTAGLVEEPELDDERSDGQKAEDDDMDALGQDE